MEVLVLVETHIVLVAISCALKLSRGPLPPKETRHRPRTVPVSGTNSERDRGALSWGPKTLKQYCPLLKLNAKLRGAPLAVQIAWNVLAASVHNEDKFLQ